MNIKTIVWSFILGIVPVILSFITKQKWLRIVAILPLSLFALQMIGLLFIIYMYWPRK